MSRIDAMEYMIESLRLRDKYCNLCRSRFRGNSPSEVCLRCQPTAHQNRITFWNWYAMNDPEMSEFSRRIAEVFWKGLEP